MKLKHVLLLLLTILLPAKINAQAVDIVRDFGNSMHLWTMINDINYRGHLESLCDEWSLRISDKIAEDIISRLKKSDRTGSLMLASYLNWFEYSMRDSIIVNFSDYALVNKNDIKCKTKFAKEKIKDESREYVVCKLSTSGPYLYDEWVLICVRDNKIFGITKMERKGKRVLLK